MIMMVKRFYGAMFFAGTLVCAGEGFETLKISGLGSVKTEVGFLSAAKGHAEVHGGHAKSGKQSLRLMGGENQTVELALPEKSSDEVVLSFWAERWTSRAPFQFRIEERRGEIWSEVYNGDMKIRVGGFLTLVEVPLTARNLLLAERP